MLNDKDGKMSVTRTSYVAGVVIVLFKMLISGMTLTFGDVSLAAGIADLAGMAAILGVLAANFYGSEKSKRETNNVG